MCSVESLWIIFFTAQITNSKQLSLLQKCFTATVLGTILRNVICLIFFCFPTILHMFIVNLKQVKLSWCCILIKM